MGDEKGTLETRVPFREVEEELARIVQVAEGVATYRDDVLAVYAYKIIREAVPGMTREWWARLVKGDILATVEPVERTCTCDACEDDQCQGDCNECGDHGCQACYGDHDIYECCGYCPDCDEHPRDANSANYHRCAECDRCSECEHYCG